MSDLMVAHPNVQVTVYGEITLLDAPHPKPNKSRLRKARVVVYERDSWTCQECGRVADEPTAEERAGLRAPGWYKDGDCLELDHIVPRAAGGPFVPENLRAACSPCNRLKSASMRYADWPARISRAQRILQRQRHNEETAMRAVAILLGED